MAMCAHSPGKAKGKCPPKEVAKEFSHKPPGGYSNRKKKKPYDPRNVTYY
jgi:hypothetical protein